MAYDTWQLLVECIESINRRSHLSSGCLNHECVCVEYFSGCKFVDAYGVLCTARLEATFRSL